MIMSKFESKVGLRWAGWLTAWVGLLALPAVWAGTQGAYMNSAGYGKAVSAVTYGGGKTAATSAAMYYPCAAVNPEAGFACVTPSVGLPAGTPGTVFCQTKGAPNFRWSIKSYVTGGATADNPELDNRIPVVPAPCASYSMETAAVFDDANRGSITVNAVVSAGAAIWLRGYEYLGAGEPTDLGDLISNGVLKWDMVLVGPFNLDQQNCTAMTLPFTTVSGHENLYFVTDAVAKSTPLTLTCGGPVVIGCGDPLAYPEAQVSGGCGQATVSYSPLPTALPFGVPTVVTATAVDEQGNTATCTFTATRESLKFTGFASPIGGTGGSCSAPLTTLARGPVVPVKFTAQFCPGPIATTRAPVMTVRRCVPTASGVVVSSGIFRRTTLPNEWYYNWNTAGLTTGVYQLVATMQDGTVKEAFVRVQ